MADPISDCLLCALPSKDILAEDRNWVVTREPYPVTPGHVVIVSKRHVSSYFDLTDEERGDLHDRLVAAKAAIVADDDTVSGFNIGMNDGVDAGQTIFHCNAHLIPRRPGDIEDPRGGVRVDPFTSRERFAECFDILQKALAE